MRRFVLARDVDHSGVSGTGIVAEGVLFSNGLVALGWKGEWPSINMHIGMDSITAIHGHGGDTKVIWLDPR